MIAERVQPVTETERVPLAAARGRVLAADVIAPLDLPPFDNSAVDGYAVRHRDLGGAGETRLAIGGRLTAGSATASRANKVARICSEMGLAIIHVANRSRRIQSDRYAISA